MYTESEITDLLEKASYIIAEYSKELIFPDATNREIMSRVYILNRAVSYERWRTGVTAYNDIAVALYDILEVFDYLFPVPSQVADFYPIDGNAGIRYVTGINDSTISTTSTWSSFKINRLLNDSDLRKTKIPITVAGTKTITWQTDIAPDSSLTYAAKHGNKGITAQGFYDDGGSEYSYNPAMIVARTGALITSVSFTDTFVGYIIIT